MTAGDATGGSTLPGGDSEVDDLFLRVIAAEGAARAGMLSELCEAHPSQASELRRRFDEHAALSRMLGGLDEGAASLAVQGGDLEESAAWDSFLGQLRSRGDAWSRYLVEGEIARGGMGVVHRAIDRDARRRVALKVMRESNAGPSQARTPGSDARTLGRFLEEAQVTSQLDHPGIVPVHEIGIDPVGRVYFTMKLVKGEDFQRIIERIEAGEEGWSLTRGVAVLLRVCEAMSYAHAKGVLHRDLKPSNLMVGRYGEAYVMDWGLARVVGRDDRRDLRIVPPSAESVIRSERNEALDGTPDSPLITMDGDVVGTPAYMPPEQAFGQLDQMGPASDVYAMGAILYHLLTGRIPYVPFGARLNARAIHARVMQGPPESVAELRPRAPAELIAICEKAMARGAEDRYCDMAELATDLRAFLERRVVSAYETGLLAQLRKLVSRNRVAAVLLGAAILVITAVTLVSMQSLRQQRNAAAHLAEEKERERLRASSALDEVRLQQLQQSASACFPISIARRGELLAWLQEASRLRAGLPQYDAVLREVVAERVTDADPRLEWLREKREAAALAASSDTAALLEQARAIETSVERHPFVASDAWGSESVEDAANDDVRFWAKRIQQLCLGIRALEQPQKSLITVPLMRQYLALLGRVTEESEAARGPWAEVIDALSDLARSPEYGGLVLTELPDLVPLGKNPTTGLQEFWHVASGARPERDATTGRWRHDEASGIVFVLLPSTRFMMGSQRFRRDLANYDDSVAWPGEVTERKSRPFFVASTELTQGQWLRLAGLNPSFFAPGGKTCNGVVDLSHPVESVDAPWARDVLARFGLRLPFEFEWEYACRAGSEEPWWCGSQREDVLLVENLGAEPDADGSVADRAPMRVASFAANPFGLHDLGGNVHELCGDVFRWEYWAEKDRDGNDLGHSFDEGSSEVAVRGGSYSSRPEEARSAVRRSLPRTKPRCDVGLRAVRELPR